MEQKKVPQKNQNNQTAAQKDDTGNPPPDFPVVGIGASAGGLAAFEAFFSGMPRDTDPGMAFILVQHLAPDHKSILTDLVGRYTRMKVFEVEDGMIVRPNCAYIIPPGKDMAYISGALQLMEPAAPRGKRMPIDFFFRTLAQEQHEKAIGVVLSGTGSDGTLGVRAIKGEGGMVMVQEPATTEYDGMPRSALATGMVDYELPPAEMPVNIIEYARRAIAGADRPAGHRPPAGNENALKKIFLLLRTHSGHDFSQYKPNTVYRRIERRMAMQQIENPEEYVRYLQQTPAEIEALFRDMLIGVTSFFRDPEAFEALEQKIIAGLFSEKKPNETVRVWSAGCSTGEEAYSLAILLAEHQQRLKERINVQIFATDIDSQAIAAARAGIYPASIAADILQNRLERFFSLEPGGSFYQISKKIRDMMVFSEQNVIKDPPFSKLDLASCRNLMIYMGHELQKKIIPLLHYALNPGGVLFLGSSETIGEFGNLFSTLDRRSKIYQKKNEARRAGLYRFMPPMTAADEPTARPLQKQAVRGKSLREITENALIQQIVAAAVLVNANGDILYLHGRTGSFLEPAQGEAGVNNILKMAREGLQQELATALRKAAAGMESVRCPNLRVKTNGDYTTIHLTVKPLGSGKSGQARDDKDQKPDSLLILVVMETAEPRPRDRAALSTDTADDQTQDAAAHGNEQAVIAELRQELRTREEYLQTTREELETANEELRTSNEDMQSYNEELQSTNEELETSKEELQSVNEELSTVNAELQNKVADLTRANDDMNNLLAGTGIASVFVDYELRILRYTPAATRIINLIQTDVGRPVSHIVSNLEGYNTLQQDIREVLDTLVPRETEVRTRAGAWYTMRILPYRTLNNVIEGAVVTFVDITSAKRSQQALQEAHVRITESIVEAVHEPLLVLDSGLKVISANKAFCDTFAPGPDDVVGCRLYDLENGQWDIPGIRKLMEEMLPADSAVNDYVITVEFKETGFRNLQINARTINEAGESSIILLAIKDITREKRKNNEQQG
ncbi:MAG: PAS domain-containing protein [Desulfobacteraceae bacterium]|nr:PAS domain-containing protein [Desulfobacteraceae bacterium]